MSGDKELQVMAEICAALEPLTPDARERVLRWASAKHAVYGSTPIDKAEGCELLASLEAPDVGGEPHEPIFHEPDYEDVARFCGVSGEPREHGEFHFKRSKLT